MGQRNTSWWIVASSVIATGLVGGAGCLDETATPETNIVFGADTKIFAGQTDNDAKAASNVVALKVGTEGDYELCSGALIAPNVVLTARHCVAKTITASVSCDENGESTNGKHVNGNHAPADIRVFTGASPRFSEAPNAFAANIISPEGDTLCDQDIALIVLDHELTDVEPLAVRVGHNAGGIDGETIRSVGYGKNDQKMPLGTRLRKDGVEILAMGRGVSHSQTALGTHEFEVGKSICEGDSGGPALSEETGAIIGVVSRGGSCDDDFGHIYTATADFQLLFDEAFKIAGGAPIVESGQPEGTQTAAHPVPQKQPVGSNGETTAPAAPAAAGCSSTSPTRGKMSSTALLVFAAALVLRRRRRD